jgi:hypothetical protein
MENKKSSIFTIGSLILISCFRINSSLAIAKIIIKLTLMNSLLLCFLICKLSIWGNNYSQFVAALLEDNHILSVIPIMI